MSSKPSKISIVYRKVYESEYQMPKYRNIKIHPKILEEKSLDEFTPEEKKTLTRKKYYWYVYFDFINPVTNEFERQKPEKQGINRERNFDERYKLVHLLKKGVKQALQQGYDPYSELGTDPDKYTLEDSLEYGLKIKKPEVGKRTYDTYESHVNQFKEWARKNGYIHSDIEKIDKKIVMKFLNYISNKNENKTRNNYKSSLSAIFTVLEDADYIQKNFIKNIKKLQEKTERDPTFSKDQLKKVFSYWKGKDHGFVIYMYFVMYMFWRNKENCRIKVKDVNLEERIISIKKTKGTGRKVKLIPDIIYDQLKAYIKDADPEYFLFTPEGKPGPWINRDGKVTRLDNRRNFFSGKWRNNREAMELGPEYVVYGLRHTGATILYKSLVPVHGHDKTIQIMSKITGHTSKAILEYIHYIDAALPEDWSGLIQLPE